MRTLVLGLGNVLMGDDAFGPYAVRTLEAAYDPGPDVRMEDLGTPGLDLTPHLHGVEALVVLDTVKSAGAPGGVRLYRRDAILAQPILPRLNPHQPGLSETLLLLELLGEAPAEVLLVGVVPERVEMGTALSPAVRAAVPEALAEVVWELERLGHAVAPHPHPRPADIWWEATCTR